MAAYNSLTQLIARASDISPKALAYPFYFTLLVLSFGIFISPAQAETEDKIQALQEDPAELKSKVISEKKLVEEIKTSANKVKEPLPIKEDTPIASNQESSTETSEEEAKKKKKSKKKKKQAKENGESSSNRLIVGWVEKIKVKKEGLLFNAKLTPGSEGNVFHAKNIQPFQKSGEDWVKFEVSDRKGKEVSLEKPISDEKSYRDSKGKLYTRPHVKLGVCLAGIYMDIDFGLEDRSKFDQEVRVGREALAGNFLIDPSLERSTQPNCK